MGKVNVSAENQVENIKKDPLPPNSMVEVVEAEYARILKEGFTNPKTGENIPESNKTYAVLTCVLPESMEPTKQYTVELGVGEYLIPNDETSVPLQQNGTYLDDSRADTDKHKKLHASSGLGGFVKSLRTAGAANGMYTKKEDDAFTDNIKNFIGSRFQSGYVEKQGNTGSYQSLIATQVYNFGKVNVQADMDAVVGSTRNVLASAPVGGYKVAELVGKLGNLTGAQFELAKQSFNSEEWIKSAEAAGAFKRTPTGLFVKA